MSASQRRLPEDSLVNSLTEIQALLREGDHRRPVPVAPAPEALAEDSLDLFEPVVSAQEVRAQRHARWEEDARPRVAPSAAPRSRKVIFAGALLAVLSVGGLIFAFVPAGTPPVTSEVKAAAVMAASVAPPPVAPLSAEVSVTPEAAIAPVAAVAKTPRKAGSPPRTARKIAGNDELDRLFGRSSPRVAAKPKRTPRPKGKSSKSDRQLDSILDSL